MSTDSGQQKLMGAAKLGLTVGGVAGIVRFAEGGKPLPPFLQASAAGAVVGYFLADQDDFIKSGAIGVAMGGMCYYSKQSNDKCAMYALTAAVTSYIAIKIVAPEIAVIQARYFS